MSLVTIAQVRALIETDLGDSDLQGVVDREEKFLARRIGALSGARSETFHVYGVDRPLELRRPTSAATATDDGTAEAVRLLGDGWLVESTAGSWDGPVVVTYTPSDEDEVKAVVLELVRIALASSAFTQESWANTSYSKPTMREQLATRELLAATLQRPRSSGSIGVRTSLLDERVGETV